MHFDWTKKAYNLAFGLKYEHIGSMVANIISKMGLKMMLMAIGAFGQAAWDAGKHGFYPTPKRFSGHPMSSPKHSAAMNIVLKISDHWFSLNY